MVAQDLLPAGVALVLGIGLGYGIAHLPPATEATRPVARPLARAASTPAAVRTLPPFHPSGNCTTDLAALTERSKSLEQQLAFQSFVLDSVRAQREGKPLQWTDSVPDRYRKEAVEKAVRDSLDQCHVDADFMGIDCSEPPCIAQIRPRAEDPQQAWLSSLMACAPWKDLYGEAASVMTDSLKCPDGSSQGLGLVSPDWTNPQGGQTDEVFLQNWTKRLHTRWSDIKGSLSCGS